MGTANLFVYGTLMAEPIAKGIVGRVPVTSPATLKDHIRYRVKGAAFPAIIERQGEQVKGQLLQDLTPTELISLDEYEAEEYTRNTVTVQLDDGTEATAFVYVWREKYRNMLEEVPWNFDRFMEVDFAKYWQLEMES